MGYSTEFKGVLKFSHEPTVKELAQLDWFLGEDIRDIEPDEAHDFYYIDLQITKSYTGLEWAGTEKTYGMCEQVNWLIDKMHDLGFKDFSLTGEMLAQGESIDDRWILRMVDGRAVKVKDPPKGTRVKCPNCRNDFYV